MITGYTNTVKDKGLAVAGVSGAEHRGLTRESIRKWILGAYKFILTENLMDFLVSLKLSETSNPIFHFKATS